MYVNKLTKLWMLISAVVLCIDGFYVINRPQTLAGGKYYAFYQAYQLYTQFDKLYAANDDKFVIIQSWLNVAEATFTFIILALFLFSSSLIQQLRGSLLAIIINTMTFWKTVLFIWYDHYWLTEDAKNYTPESIMYYWIPSSLWIICPFLSNWSIMSNIVKDLKQKSKID